MTDNEIIKALECCTSDKCTCSECSYEYTKHIKNEEFEVMSNGKSYDEWSCDEWLKCDLLDLINRQQAEIVKLQKYHDDMENAIYSFREDQAEVKFFKGRIRAEAVKEFAERLKMRMERKYTVYGREYVFRHINDLVKEFTEGKDENT